MRKITVLTCFFLILYLVLKWFLTVLHHRLCAAKLPRDTIVIVVKILWHYSSCYSSHPNSKWLKKKKEKKTTFVHLVAELIGTAVTLTGDELQFQCLSGSTHPTGYAWEEKAGQVSNVMSRAKTWKHHRITVHQHQHQLVWDKSDAVIRLITSKLMKQSYPSSGVSAASPAQTNG